MANEVDIEQKQLDRQLQAALDNASTIITRTYLDKLDTYSVVKPSLEDLDIDITECGNFYKLTKLVVNKEESLLEKLTTIVNVASSIDCSIAIIIRSNGETIDYYFGIISKNSRDSSETSVRRRLANSNAMKGALSGNLVGSDIQDLSTTDIVTLKDSIFTGKNKCYSSVSGIVSLRNEEDKKMETYVQGIENLVDSLKGQKY